MIKTIEIGFLRSFAAVQECDLARPDGTPGSGYNLIVGKNNAGKSTLLRTLRDLVSRQKTITIGLESRHDQDQPHGSAHWIDEAGVEAIAFEKTESGGIFRKTGPYEKAEHCFRFVPSRRPFTAIFDSATHLEPADYEWNDFLNRRNQRGYFDSQLANSLAVILMDAKRKKEFLELLQRLDKRITGLNTDNVGGRDVIGFQSASGRWHPVADTGDGLINCVRILFTLYTAQPHSSVLIDEPELSLHPDLQRSLYRLLIDFSRDHQIIVATHSPYFVDWATLSKAGLLARVLLNSAGYSEIRVCSRRALQDVAKTAHSNVMARKNYDVVAKELFFADEAVLVEGSDDVNYIQNYLDTTSQEPLPIVGYGCGGADAIRAWMRLCNELQIRSAAIFDGDKKNEFEAALHEFEGEFSLASFLLAREDIRDKYVRDEFGKETNKILKRGIFERDGKVHKDAESAMDLLLASTRMFLCAVPG